jgi:DNA-binding response OmpR family regulator
MTTANVLLLESNRANAPSFAPAFNRKGYSVSVYNNLGNALSDANKTPPDIVVLDAASMKTSGARMCRKTRSTLDGVPIILVSPEGTQPDPGNGASLTLVHPFTFGKSGIRTTQGILEHLTCT